MKRIFAALVALTMGASIAHGAEVSGLMGIYQTEKAKNGPSTSTMSLGGRYGLDPQGNKSYFGEVEFSSTSYGGTTPAGMKKPSGISTMAVGGGMYCWLPKIDTRFIPYLSAWARFENGKNIENLYTATMAEVTTSGLAYGADMGIRFKANETWFLDFESNFFKSWLMYSEKAKDVATGATTRETSKMDLYASTTAGLTAMTIGLGMML